MAPTMDLNAYGFTTEVRVRLSETDAVGIVFFGSFAAYMDVGRMDYLEHQGLSKLDGRVRDLIPGAVVRSELEFRSPARYNEVLLIHVRLAHLGRTSYTFHFLMTNKRSRAVVAVGQLSLVWLDDLFQPTPIPEAFRAAILAFEGPFIARP
ncbi:MAG: acyl-CoA thioesterase [Myxococcales bacterium]|nr:acyl-CoA thioesterase [Myxococcales bacterium]